MAIGIREALAGALEAGRPPSFYLDTNVIRDLIRARRRSSVELFELLEKKEWPCKSTLFTRMEIFDIEQEARYFRAKLDEGMEINAIWASRRGRDLDRETLQQIETEVHEAVQRYKLIEWLYLEEDGWERAIELASRSNLPGSPDCIHLATALIATCDVLVTSDGHFSTRAKDYIASGPPDQVLKEIRSLGPK